MGKKVKYSWLSAKINPIMISDFYVKKILESEKLVDINLSFLNDIEIKIEVEDIMGKTMRIQTNPYYGTFDTDTFTDKNFITFKIKQVSEIESSITGVDVVRYGYEILLEKINKHKNVIETYNKSVLYLKELQEEYSEFKKRYL